MATPGPSSGALGSIGMAIPHSSGALGAPPDIEGAAHRTVTIQSHDAGPLDLHVYEAGAGPPVLLLHGWPQTAWCWRYVVPRLADSYRLIAPDLRGFGWSDAPGQGYDGITFGLDGLALLDALGIARAHVIGHDWGGFAAFAMALSTPSRVDRMVVLSTLPPWPSRSPRAALEYWRSSYAFVLAAAGDRILRRRPDVVARLVRADRVHDGISRADAEAYGRWMQRPESAHATKLLYRSYVRSIREVGIRDRFGDLRLTTPTRFLLGEKDKAIASPMLAGMERHGDDLTLELVADSGHFMPEEKPDLVAQRARELFAGAVPLPTP
jgi:pimeloyl-ACP methyl ester carboxylesterase